MRYLPILSLLAFAAPAAAKPSTWDLDPTHSTATFSVKHMMVTNVRGEFGKLTGTVVYDPENIPASTVEAAVDPATVDTREPKRDGHLKSPDFFDVAKFPTLTFKSKTVAKGKLTGDLTIHGVTKEVTFDVIGPTPPVKGMDGKMRSGAQAMGRISRKDFGLNWNKALEAGGVLVGDEVSILLDIELKQR